MTAFLPACSRRRTSPDFVRNRPVVLVAPLIQSIFIHVLVGNELIGSPREYISDYFDFILSKNAREEHVPTFACPAKTPDERPSSFIRGGAQGRPPHTKQVSAAA